MRALKSGYQELKYPDSLLETRVISPVQVFLCVRELSGYQLNIEWRIGGMDTLLEAIQSEYQIQTMAALYIPIRK